MNQEEIQRKAQEMVDRNIAARDEAILEVMTKMIDKGMNPDDYKICHNFGVASLDPEVPFEIWIQPRL